MTETRQKCIIADCPAQHRRCGCGYLVAGTRCNHPHQRAEWEQRMVENKEEAIQCSEQD